jgi:hypothetical protein
LRFISPSLPVLFLDIVIPSNFGFYV